MERAEEISMIETDKLKPDPKNPRQHSRDQIARIARSITTFGFNNPILIRSDNTIIAGHGRLAAAQRLGMESVPVVVLDHLDAVRARAYLIADNRTAEVATWDDHLLASVLNDLELLQLDLTETGFSWPEIGEIMESLSELEVDSSTESEQGKLDVKKMVTCPKCGHEFST